MNGQTVTTDHSSTSAPLPFAIDSFELPMGMVEVVNAEARLLHANAALQRMLGAAAGTALAALMPAADCASFLAQGAQPPASRVQMATVLRGAAGPLPAFLHWLPTVAGTPAVFSVAPMEQPGRSLAGRERALLEYEALMKHAPVGVAFGSDRRLVRYNEEFARLFGIAGDEGVGQLARTLYPSDEAYHAVGRHAYPRLVANGSFHDEIEFRRADGSTFWGGAWAFLINPDDAHQGTIWIVSDITARRQAESLLRASLLEWEAIFHNASIGIGFTLSGVLQRCNARAAAILGYTPQQIVGQETALLYPSRESFEQARAVAGPLLAAGQPYEVDCQFRHRDGSLVWCRVCAKALDPQRQERGTVWIIEDLSAARTAQTQLHNALLDYQGIMNNASVGILHTSERQIQRYNPKFSELFGYPGDSAVGLPGRALYRSDEEYAELGRLAGPLLSQGQPVQREMYMQRRDGSAFWANLFGYVADPANPTHGTWWILEDRSAFKRTEEALQRNYAELQTTHAQLEQAQAQLLQSEKMASIGQLAAGVAHEINNPVGFVNSNLGTLGRYVGQLLDLVSSYEQALRGLPVPSEVGSAIEAARAAADIDYLRDDIADLLRESQDGLGRVRHIVQDLKDFSHVDGGEWQAVDLNAGVRSTLNMVRNETKYKAEVTLELGELPLVCCNPAQINQVLMNLLVNAAHAIEHQGRIVVRSGVEGQWAWLEVEDNGSGIAPEIQARIFDPFFTTKPVGKGTGLGLSVSYGIVNKHGGRFEMASTPGQGSRFRFWLPVDGHAEPPKEP